MNTLLGGIYIKIILLENTTVEDIALIEWSVKSTKMYAVWGWLLFPYFEGLTPCLRKLV